MLTNHTLLAHWVSRGSRSLFDIFQRYRIVIWNYGLFPFLKSHTLLLGKPSRTITLKEGATRPPASSKLSLTHLTWSNLAPKTTKAQNLPVCWNTNSSFWCTHTRASLHANLDSRFRQSYISFLISNLLYFQLPSSLERILWYLSELWRDNCGVMWHSEHLGGAS